MPGTSENFEIMNFDGVPNKLVAPIRLLLNHFTLEEHLDFKLNGVPLMLSEQYSYLTEEEWEYIFKNVIFSKLTALELNKDYSKENLDYLSKVFTKMSCIDTTVRLQVEELPSNYVFARKWLRKLNELQAIKK